MANEVLQKLGTATVWANTTDYSSTVSGLTRTHQIDLTSLGASAAREGAKADLGATTAAQYALLVAFEMAVAPTSTHVIETWLGWSPSSTAGNANPGGLGGTDAAYTGTAGDSLDDSIVQLDGPYTLSMTADATTVVQYARVGTIFAPMRYVVPVVYNKTTQAHVADAVEQYVALLPIIDEIQ